VYPATAQLFWVPPIISGTGKATNLQFCMHIYRLNRNKSPSRSVNGISGKVAVGVVRDTRKFSGQPYRAHRAVSFAQPSCVRMDPVIVLTKFEVRSFTRSSDNSD